MGLIENLAEIVGAANVLTGDDTAKYRSDWMGYYTFTPQAVVRPGSTSEISEILKLANETKTPIVPVSGNTSLAGGTHAEGAVMVSVDRMNAIREIRADARIAVVEAGVIPIQPARCL